MPHSMVDHILVKYDKKADISVCLRACRTPDRKSVVGAWALYEDVNELLPSKKGWEPPDSPSPPPFEIVPIESKGRGLIATRNIKKGELILRERPILVIPRELLFGDERCQWLEFDKLTLQLVYWLEQSDRDKFLQLHNCKSPDECGPLTGIVRTNGVPATFPESQTCPTYACVCLNMSYANHSCDPNAVQKFDRRAFTQELFASRNIAEEEEINIGYVGIIAPRAERQEQLKAKYGFACTCEQCSVQEPYASQSDKLRQHIRTTLFRMASGYFQTELVECHPAKKRQLAERQIGGMEAILLAMEVENVSEGRILITRHLACLYALFADLQNFRKWTAEILRILEEEKDSLPNWEEAHSQWQTWSRNPILFETWATLR